MTAAEATGAPAAAGANGNLLEATGVSKVFGGLVAVNDVDFAVPRGGIVSIIGPNGAGKTTFFNCMTGLYTPTTGRVVFDGKDITAKPPHVVTQAGIARTFQNIKLFKTMTVLENVMVGRHARMKARITGSIFRSPFMRREEKEVEEYARDLLKEVGLQKTRYQAPGGEPAVRRSAAAGDRPRAGVRSAAAAARRADRRHEPAGVRRAARADGEAARPRRTCRSF